jgi:hypothetical protein
MNANERYAKTRDIFAGLCQRTGLPVPTISMSEPGDICDFTSHEAVRLNLSDAANWEPEEHAAHVFGHYICDLHQWGNETDHPISDEVADVIAKMIERGGVDG